MTTPFTNADTRERLNVVKGTLRIATVDVAIVIRSFVTT
jgi:hypothetical protein